MKLGLHLRHDPHFKAGTKAMMPMALGIFAWGLMTAIAMVNSGLGVWTSSLMTLSVFAGSAQLATTPLIIAQAPMWVILATACCVNLRFVVFSIHLRPYMMHLSLKDRLFTGYFTGDISYVLTVNRYPHPADTIQGKNEQIAYLLGTNWINWLSWMSGSFIGISLTAYIPIEWGLGFAGTLALLGMTCMLVNNWLKLLGVVVSSVAAIVAFALPLKLNIVVAIACAVMLCLLAENFKKPVIVDKTQHH